MRAIKYPFRIENGEPVEVDEDADAVASAISLLTAQDNGDRVYDDPNGFSVYQYVFENNDSLLRANLRRAFRLAIERNESRIEPVAVFVRNLPGEVRGADVVEVSLLWSFLGRTFGFSTEFNRNQGSQR
jgi:phage baseplate assembly protein W